MFFKKYLKVFSISIALIQSLGLTAIHCQAAADGNSSGTNVPAIASSGVFPVGSKINGFLPGSGFALAISHRDLEKKESSNLQNIYVVTCAHLTSGPQLQILGQDVRPEEIVGRWTDSIRDIDIIEIKNSRFGLKPLAWYELPEKTNSQLGPANWTPQPLVVYPEAFQKIQNLQSIFPAESRSIIGDANGAQLIGPKWAALPQFSPPLKDPIGFNSLGTNSDTYRESITYQVFGGKISAPVKIAPGMSCAPLVKKNSRGQLEILGMGVEYYRDFRRSTFVSDVAIANALDRYLIDGARGQVDSTRWKEVNGFQYRAFDKDKSEIAPLSNFTNATIIQAGRWQGTPPGRFTATPPALPETEFPSFPSHVGSETAAKCDVDSPLERVQKMGIDPEMTWNNQPIIGFKVVAGETDDPVFLYGNLSTIELIKRCGSILKSVETIPRGALLIDFLPEKLKLKFQETRQSFSVPSFPNALSSMSQSYMSSNQTSTKLELHENLLDIDRTTVQIELNEFGGLMNQSSNHFNPLIEVVGTSRGNQKTSFVIDLTRLYFSDLTQVFVPEQDKSKVFFTENLCRFPENKADDLFFISKLLKLAKFKSGEITMSRKCRDTETIFTFKAPEDRH